LVAFEATALGAGAGGAVVAGTGVAAPGAAATALSAAGLISGPVGWCLLGCYALTTAIVVGADDAKYDMQCWKLALPGYKSALTDAEITQYEQSGMPLGRFVDLCGGIEQIEGASIVRTPEGETFGMTMTHKNDNILGLHCRPFDKSCNLPSNAAASSIQSEH